jgi:hypothetical protein
MKIFSSVSASLLSAVAIALPLHASVPQAPDLGIILHVAWRLKPVNTRLMVLETRIR